MSTTPSSADERARIAEVLEQCLRWHNGDKDRDSDEAARRMAWSQHRALLQSTIASLGAAQVPALWVSPEQADAHTDLDDPTAGRYLPCRRTPAGKFTMPLYAQPAGAAQVPSLSDAQIVEIAERHGLCTVVENAGYRADALWFDGQKFDFARAIEAAALSQPSQQGQGS